MRPEEVDGLAGEVVSRLLSRMLVRLAGVSFASEAPEDADLAVRASISLDVRCQTDEDGDGIFRLTCAYRLAAEPTVEDGLDSVDDPKPAWSCTVEIQGQWIIRSVGELTANHLRAFAARVGLMALHPYARSQVQSLVTESGWPPYTLDVLTPHSDLFSDADRPEELDLSGISVALS